MPGPSCVRRAPALARGPFHSRPRRLLSPLGWEHINLTGDYHWDTSPTLGPDEFRPLRTHAHDFAAAAIAVGMLITEHLPHRSRRADFTHRAPTLGILPRSRRSATDEGYGVEG